VNTDGWSNNGRELSAALQQLLNAIEDHGAIHPVEAAAMLHGLFAAARLGTREFGAAVIAGENRSGATAAAANYASKALTPRAADAVASVRATIAAITSYTPVEQDCAWEAIAGLFLAVSQPGTRDPRRPQ